MNWIQSLSCTGKSATMSGSVLQDCCGLCVLRTGLVRCFMVTIAIWTLWGCRTILMFFMCSTSGTNISFGTPMLGLVTKSLALEASHWFWNENLYFDSTNPIYVHVRWTCRGIKRENPSTGLHNFTISFYCHLFCLCYSVKFFHLIYIRILKPTVLDHTL